MDRIVKTVPLCRGSFIILVLVTSQGLSLTVWAPSSPIFWNFKYYYFRRIEVLQRNRFYFLILVFMLSLILLITNTSREVHSFMTEHNAPLVLRSHIGMYNGHFDIYMHLLRPQMARILPELSIFLPVLKQTKAINITLFSTSGVSNQCSV